ncbi:MAG TPA: acetyl-CoA carboxylase biotin carboxyl carrier protein subunit [Anaerolineae bacterium]|jgi:biotin carboxyl carrier protein|nr:acetyl-CoA carboxylase biotin carboxyl carrier protein subunit [Anaerolineae bacterium]
MKYVATVEGREYEIELTDAGVLVDGVLHDVDLQAIDGGFHYSLLVGPCSHELFVERCEDVCLVGLRGRRYHVKVEDERERRSGVRSPAVRDAAGRAEVVSPMPGMVVAVLVEEGQQVITGQGLVIVEAMKMENEIRTPVNGVVESVAVAAGQGVAQNDLLVRVGPG